MMCNSLYICKVFFFSFLSLQINPAAAIHHCYTSLSSFIGLVLLLLFLIIKKLQV